MTYVNCSVQNQRSEELLILDLKKMEAERDFWRSQARHYLGELENIPRALREFGEWHITDNSGETTHVILDPEHHPTKSDS